MRPRDFVRSGHLVLTAVSALVLLQAASARALDSSRSLTQYNSQAWTSVEGLPQASVQAIAQTPDGYLWLGTRAGLVRFDGHSFTVFDPESAPGLEGRSIQALHVAPDGSLWIGTDGKGLTRYRDGVFRTLGSAEGVEGDSGNSIHSEVDGTLWFATWVGVLRYDGTKAKRFDTRAGIPHNSVFGLTGDGEGTVWAATPQGLAEFRMGRLVGTRRDLGGEPQCVLRDRKGVLWVGTSGGLDRIDGKITHLTTKDGLLANFVNALAEDREGNIWIGTEGGLNRWSRGRRDGLSAANGLAGNAVASLFEDREGNLWAGLRGVGLVRFREGAFTTYTRREGLSEDVVNCIFQSSRGDVWFGTAHGLTRLRDGRFRVFTKRDGLSNDSVTGIGELRDGAILVGTFAKKLNLIRADSVSVFEPVTIESTVPSVIHVDRGGALWVGTLGVGLYRVKDGRVEHFPFRNSSGQGVIYGVKEDAAGTLWFATPNGLIRHSGGSFESVAVVQSGENRGVLFSIHEAGAGALWIGTRDSGVCHFVDGHVERCFGRKEGLAEDTIYGVVADDSERLWLSSPRGIAMVPLGDFAALVAGRIPRLSPTSFGVSDGLMTDECQGMRWPSAWRASDGRLWFPTSRGGAVVDPRRLGPTSPPPPTVIEQVAVDGQVLTAAAGRVTADPGRGELEVQYAGLSFRAPEKVRFRYRLDGFDRGWVEAAVRRKAYYTNLPPGTYRFRLIAAMEGGAWSDAETTMQIVLAPHFYQTKAWLFSLLILAVLVLFAAYRWRVRHLDARAEELSRKVTEALANVRVLPGLIPICMSCKRIRSDKGFWEQIEAYIRAHSEADFSHGICPECVRELYPEFADRIAPASAEDPAGKV